MIGIYKITSPTGKIYIGQSVDIRKRWKEHKTDTYPCKLRSSLISHGYKNHIFQILEECEIRNLNERERHFQDFYDVLGPNGLNLKLTETSDKSGKFSQELKDKISIANKVFYTTLSEEQRLVKNLRNSNSNKGRVFTKEHIENLKISNKNPSPQHRKNLSICKSKKVVDIQTGEIFGSIKEAAESINMTPDHLRNCLKGSSKNKTNFKYYKDGSK